LESQGFRIAVARWHAIIFRRRDKETRAVSLRPNLDEQRNFLLRTYFGADRDQRDSFITGAYRDMNRTLHGLSKQENAKELVEKARKTCGGPSANSMA
jgi:hypothetical protein